MSDITKTPDNTGYRITIRYYPACFVISGVFCYIRYPAG